jgi:hypothetical protein
MRYTINDLLDIQSHSLTAKSLDIAMMLGIREDQRNPARRVAVVTDDLLILQHVCAHLGRGKLQLEVFNLLGDARNWVESLGTDSKNVINRP